LAREGLPGAAFDEPTRGIDVAAKDAITRCSGTRGGGQNGDRGVERFAELMSLCDRILVMSAGKLAGEFLPGEWSQEKITRAAFSGHLETSAQKREAETSTRGQTA
jgi:ribose transport system ATP-binding protein